MRYPRRFVISLIGGFPAVAAAIVGAVVAAYYTTSFRDASDRAASCDRAIAFRDVIVTEIDFNDAGIRRTAPSLDSVSEALEKYIEEPVDSLPGLNHGYFGLRASAIGAFLSSESSRFADAQGLTLYMSIYDRYRYANEVKQLVDDALVEFIGASSITEAHSLAKQLRSRVDQLREIYSALLDLSGKLPNVVRDENEEEPLHLIPLDSDGKCTL